MGTNRDAVAETIAEPSSITRLWSRRQLRDSFINFTLSDDFLAGQAPQRVSEDHGGIRSGAGQTVVIDYSSPVAKLYVGHMRSTIIEAALDRLYRGLGWTVIADNHIGDWGTQFGKLIVAWSR